MPFKINLNQYIPSITKIKTTILKPDPLGNLGKSSTDFLKPDSLGNLTRSSTDYYITDKNGVVSKAMSVENSRNIKDTKFYPKSYSNRIVDKFVSNVLSETDHAGFADKSFKPDEIVVFERVLKSLKQAEKNRAKILDKLKLTDSQLEYAMQGREKEIKANPPKNAGSTKSKNA